MQPRLKYVLYRYVNDTMAKDCSLVRVLYIICTNIVLKKVPNNVLSGLQK